MLDIFSEIPYLTGAIDYFDCKSKTPRLFFSKLIIIKNGRISSIFAHANQDEKTGDTLFSFTDTRDANFNHKYIDFLMSYDALTAMHNRDALLDKCPALLQSAKEKINAVAVLFIDIDNLKIINDSGGYDAGDQAIAWVGKIISRHLHYDDIGMRFGGDKFVIFMTDIANDRNAEMESAGILRELSAPISYKGGALSISVSIGISLYPKHGDNCADLLKFASLAMHRAKSEGKDSYCFYNKLIDNRDNSIASYRHSFDMKSNIANSHFFFMYQPQVNLTSGEIIGLEALIRLKSPDGIIAPDKFIPIIEATGQIVELGEWTVNEVIRQIADWESSGINVPRVSINLSPKSFTSQRIVHCIKKTLEDTGVSPAKVCIEMTESALIVDRLLAKTVMQSIKDIGIRLSLDDFGIGYASIDLLRDYCFDEIKIDKSFINGITLNTESQCIVQSIIYIANGLGKEVLPEGIEDEKQCTALIDMGCRIGQGFYFSKPIMSSEIGRLLAMANIKSSAGAAR